jgi:hypothetical protein
MIGFTLRPVKPKFYFVDCLNPKCARLDSRPLEAVIAESQLAFTPGEGLTPVRCGGRFEGSAVLHWAGGVGGKIALLPGAIIEMVADRKHVFLAVGGLLLPRPPRTHP